MHDDKDQYAHEDEYQFPEEEFVQGEATGRPSVEPDLNLEQEARNAQREKIMKVYGKIRELLANRIIAAVIGVIILLICFHWIMSGSLLGQKKKPVQTIQSTPVTQTQVSQPNPQVISAISGIKQSAGAMQNTVTQLQGQVQQLQSTVTQMAQNRQSYDSALMDLGRKITAMQNSEKKLLAMKKKSPVKSDAHAIKLPPLYFYTRAVVHNRAWVVGSNGANATITIGDHLKDYGKILNIDANTGDIKTSSGRTIKFASGDQ